MHVPSLCNAPILALLLLPAIAQSQTLSTLDKIKKTGEITIGWRESPPFSFAGDGGLPTGYQIELCLRVAETARKALGMQNLAIKYEKVDLKTRIDRLKDGSIDLECASSTNTRARQEQVGVSYNTFVTGVRLLVPREGRIASIKDLAGKRLAVAAGSSTVKLARDIAGMHALTIKIVEFEGQPAAMKAVLTGEADAMISEEPILAALAARPEGQSLHVVGPHLSIEPYAILMRKADPAFEKILDKALADAFASKDAMRLFEKWFNPVSGIRIPLNQHIRECFAYPTKFGV